jgi:hypothetical protein
VGITFQRDEASTWNTTRKGLPAGEGSRLVTPPVQNQRRHGYLWQRNLEVEADGLELLLHFGRRGDPKHLYKAAKRFPVHAAGKEIHRHCSNERFEVGSTQRRHRGHRGHTIGTDADGRGALVNFQASVVRAVQNQATYQFWVPSRVGNRRPRSKRNPQQIHFAWADRSRDGFHILHVVFGREIDPVTIGETATVPIVQHEGPVFGKSPEVPGYAWCRAKPFEVAD